MCGIIRYHNITGDQAMTGEMKSETVVFKTTKEIKDRLKSAAQAENRTVSNFTHLILVEHLHKKENHQSGEIPANVNGGTEKETA